MPKDKKTQTIDPRRLQGKTTNWVKNFGRSVKFASVEVMKDLAPNIFATGENFGELAKSLVDELKSFRTVQSRINKALEQSVLMKEAKDFGKNLKKDIKSGDFWNEAREKKFKAEEEAAFAEGFEDDSDYSFSDEDTNMEFNPDSGDDSSFDSSEFDMSGDVAEGVNGGLADVKPAIKAGAKASILTSEAAGSLASGQLKQTKATVAGFESAGKIAQQIGITSLAMNQKFFDQSVDSYKAMNENLGKLVAFNDETVSKLAMGALKYYEDQLNVTNNILAELQKISAKVAPDGSEENEEQEDDRSDFSRVLSGKGIFKPKEYLKLMWDKNIRRAVSNSALSDLLEVWDHPEVLKDFVAHPLRSAATLFAESLIPDMVKNSMTNLDKTVAAFFPALFQKISNYQNSSNDLKRFFGEMFGLENDIDTTVNTGNYKKGEVPFDGITHRTINVVIPEYLAGILAAVSNKEQLAYDYERGNFTTKKELQMRFNEEDDNLKLSGYRDYLDLYNKIFDTVAVGKHEDDKKNYMDLIKQILRDSVINGDLINPSQKEFDYERYFGDANGEEATIHKAVTNIIQKHFLPKLMGLSLGRYNSAEALKNKYKDINDPNSYNNSAIKLNYMQGFSNLRANQHMYFDDEGNIKYVEEKRNNPYGNEEYSKTPVHLLRDIKEILIQGIRVYPIGTEGIAGENSNVYDVDKRLSEWNSTRDEMYREIEEFEEYENKSKLTPAEKFKEDSTKKIVVGDQEVSKLGVEGVTALMEANLKNVLDKENKKKTKMGGIYEFIDKWFNDTTFSDKIVDIKKAVEKFLRVPSEFIRDSLDKISTGLYNVIYGDGEGKSFIDVAKEKMKETFTEFNEWLKKKWNASTNYLFGEGGLFESKPFKWVKDKANSMIDLLFGKENSNGSRENGAFSGAFNAISDTFLSVRNELFGTEFTDSAGKHHVKNEKSIVSEITSGISSAIDEMTKYLFGEPEKDANGNKISFADSMYNKLSTGFTNFSNFFFGKKMTEEDGKASFKSLADDFEKGLPKALAVGAVGAGIALFTDFGLLGSLILPGGPIGGAILGVATGFAMQSDKFKNFLFGKIGEDGTRVGGLISKKIQTWVIEHKTALIGGATFGALKGVFAAGLGLFSPTLGALASFLVPGGPIFGAIAGAAVGIAYKSQMFQNFLFGKIGENGVRVGGIINSKMTDSISKHFPNMAFGALSFGAGAAVIGQMGLLGSLLTPGGVLGAAILGAATGIAISSEKFRNFLFGKTDEKTGLKEAGLFTKLSNVFSLSIVEPFKLKMEKFSASVELWFTKSISAPFKAALKPLQTQFDLIGKDLKALFKNGWETVANTIDNVFEKAFGAPLGEFLEDKVFKPMRTFMDKLFNNVFKVFGFILSSPIKALSFVTSGLLQRQTERGIKENREARNDAFKSSIGVFGKALATKLGFRKPEEPKEGEERKEEPSFREAWDDMVAKGKRAISQYGADNTRADGKKYINAEEIEAEKQKEIAKAEEEYNKKMEDIRAREARLKIVQETAKANGYDLVTKDKEGNVISDISPIYDNTLPLKDIDLKAAMTNELLDKIRKGIDEIAGNTDKTKLIEAALGVYETGNEAFIDVATKEQKPGEPAKMPNDLKPDNKTIKAAQKEEEDRQKKAEEEAGKPATEQTATEGNKEETSTEEEAGKPATTQTADHKKFIREEKKKQKALSLKRIIAEKGIKFDGSEESLMQIIDAIPEDATDKEKKYYESAISRLMNMVINGILVPLGLTRKDKSTEEEAGKPATEQTATEGNKEEEVDPKKEAEKAAEAIKQSNPSPTAEPSPNSIANTTPDNEKAALIQINQSLTQIAQFLTSQKQSANALTGQSANASGTVASASDSKEEREFDAKNKVDKAMDPSLKYLRIIASSVEGQLDGVGSNVYKTRKILESALGISGYNIGSGNRDRRSLKGILIEMITSPLTFIGNIIKKPFEVVFNLGKKVYETALNIVNGVGEMITSAANAVFETGKKIFNGLMAIPGMVLEVVGGIAEVTKELLIEGVHIVGEGIAGFMEAGFKVISSAAEGLGELISGIGKGLGSVFKGIGKITGSLFTGIGKAVKGTVEAIGTIGETAIKVAGGIGEAIVKISGKAFEGITEVAKSLIDGVKDLVIGAGGALFALVASPFKFIGKLGAGLISRASHVTVDGGKLDRIVEIEKVTKIVSIQGFSSDELTKALEALKETPNIKSGSSEDSGNPQHEIQSTPAIATEEEAGKPATEQTATEGNKEETSTEEKPGEVAKEQTEENKKEGKKKKKGKRNKQKEKAKKLSGSKDEETEEAEEAGGTVSSNQTTEEESDKSNKTGLSKGFGIISAMFSKKSIIGAAYRSKYGGNLKEEAGKPAASTNASAEMLKSGVVSATDGPVQKTSTVMKAVDKANKEKAESVAVEKEENFLLRALLKKNTETGDLFAKYYKWIVAGGAALLLLLNKLYKKFDLKNFFDRMVEMLGSKIAAGIAQGLAKTPVGKVVNEVFKTVKDKIYGGFEKAGIKIGSLFSKMFKPILAIPKAIYNLGGTIVKGVSTAVINGVKLALGKTTPEEIAAQSAKKATEKVIAKEAAEKIGAAAVEKGGSFAGVESIIGRKLSGKEELSLVRSMYKGTGKLSESGARAVVNIAEEAGMTTDNLLQGTKAAANKFAWWRSLINKALEILEGMLSKTPLVKNLSFAQKLAPMIQKYLTDQALKANAGRLASAAAKSAAGAATVGAADIILGMWNSYVGYQDAARLFKINKEGVTAGMRVCAIAVKVVMGCTFLPLVILEVALQIIGGIIGWDPHAWMAQALYSLISDSKSIQELEAKQHNFEEEAKQAGYVTKDEEGNIVSVDVNRYNDEVNQSTYSKLWNKFKSLKDDVSGAIDWVTGYTDENGNEVGNVVSRNIDKHLPGVKKFVTNIGDKISSAWSWISSLGAEDSETHDSDLWEWFFGYKEMDGREVPGFFTNIGNFFGNVGVSIIGKIFDKPDSEVASRIEKDGLSWYLAEEITGFKVEDLRNSVAIMKRKVSTFFFGGLDDDGELGEGVFGIVRNVLFGNNAQYDANGKLAIEAREGFIPWISNKFTNIKNSISEWVDKWITKVETFFDLGKTIYKLTFPHGLTEFLFGPEEEPNSWGKVFYGAVNAISSGVKSFTDVLTSAISSVGERIGDTFDGFIDSIKIGFYRLIGNFPGLDVNKNEKYLAAVERQKVRKEKYDEKDKKQKEMASVYNNRIGDTTITYKGNFSGSGRLTMSDIGNVGSSYNDMNNCAITALSEATGIDPEYAANFAEMYGYKTSEGTDENLFPAIAESVGGRAIKLNSFNEIKDASDAGATVVVGGVGSAYTDAGHYSIGKPTSDGRIEIEDTRGPGYDKVLSVDEFNNQTKTAYAFAGSGENVGPDFSNLNYEEGNLIKQVATSIIDWFTSGKALGDAGEVLANGLNVFKTWMFGSIDEKVGLLKDGYGYIASGIKSSLDSMYRTFFGIGVNDARGIIFDTLNKGIDIFKTWMFGSIDEKVGLLKDGYGYMLNAAKEGINFLFGFEDSNGVRSGGIIKTINEKIRKNIDTLKEWVIGKIPNGNLLVDTFKNILPKNVEEFGKNIIKTLNDSWDTFKKKALDLNNNFSIKDLFQKGLEKVSETLKGNGEYFKIKDVKFNGNGKRFRGFGEVADDRDGLKSMIPKRSEFKQNLSDFHGSKRLLINDDDNINEQERKIEEQKKYAVSNKVKRFSDVEEGGITGNSNNLSHNKFKGYGEDSNEEAEKDKETKKVANISNIQTENGDPEAPKGLPVFKQWDPRWGNKMYGHNTYTRSACGPTSMAMLATWATGNVIMPTDAAEWAVKHGHRKPGGTDDPYFDAYAKELGFGFEQTKDTEKMWKCIDEGKPFISLQDKGKFTKNGHFIVVAGKRKDGSIIVYDPNKFYGTDKHSKSDVDSTDYNNFLPTGEGLGNKSIDLQKSETKNTGTVAHGENWDSVGLLDVGSQFMKGFMSSDEENREGDVVTSDNSNNNSSTTIGKEDKTVTGPGKGIKDVIGEGVNLPNTSDEWTWEGVKGVVVHHSGPGGSYKWTADYIDKNIHKGGIDENGNPRPERVGYHFVISGDGKITRGRLESIAGAHTNYDSGKPYKLDNRNSLGIHVSGDFRGSNQPTKQQLESLAHLVADLSMKYKFPVDSSHVIPHSDASMTECPGPNLRNKLPDVLSSAKSMQESSGFKGSGNKMRIVQQSGPRCTIEATKAIYRAYMGKEAPGFTETDEDFNKWYPLIKQDLRIKEYGYNQNRRTDFENKVKEHFDAHPEYPVFLYQTGGSGNRISKPNAINRCSGNHATVLARKLKNGKYEDYDSNGAKVHVLDLEQIFDPTAKGGTNGMSTEEGNALFIPSIEPSDKITEWDGADNSATSDDTNKSTSTDVDKPTLIKKEPTTLLGLLSKTLHEYGVAFRKAINGGTYTSEDWENADIISGSSSSSGGSSSSTEKIDSPVSKAQYIDTGAQLDDAGTYMADYGKEKYDTYLPTWFWRMIVKTESTIRNNGKTITSHFNNPGGMDYAKWMNEVVGDDNVEGKWFTDNGGERHLGAKFKTMEDGYKANVAWYLRPGIHENYVKEVNFVKDDKPEEALKMHAFWYNAGGDQEKANTNYNRLYKPVGDEEYGRGKNLRTGDDKRTFKGSGLRLKQGKFKGSGLGVVGAIGEKILGELEKSLIKQAWKRYIRRKVFEFLRNRRGWTDGDAEIAIRSFETSFGNLFNIVEEIADYMNITNELGKLLGVDDFCDKIALAVLDFIESRYKAFTGSGFHLEQGSFASGLLEGLLTGYVNNKYNKRLAEEAAKPKEERDNKLFHGALGIYLDRKNGEKRSYAELFGIHRKKDKKGNVKITFGKKEKQKKKKRHRGLFGRWLNTGEDFINRVFGKKKKEEKVDKSIMVPGSNYNDRFKDWKGGEYFNDSTKVNPIVRLYLNDKASLDDVKSAVNIKDDSETLTIQQQQALGFREYSKVRNFNHFITASNIWKSTDKKTSVDSWLELHPEADMKGEFKGSGFHLEQGSFASGLLEGLLTGYVNNKYNKRLAEEAAKPKEERDNKLFHGALGIYLDRKNGEKRSYAELFGIHRKKDKKGNVEITFGKKNKDVEKIEEAGKPAVVNDTKLKTNYNDRFKDWKGGEYFNDSTKVNPIVRLYLNDKASLDDVKSAIGIKDDSETLTIQQQQALGFREYSKVRNFNHFITASNIWKSTDKKTSVDSWLELHPEADMKSGPDTEESIGEPKEEKDTTKKKRHRGLFGRWLNTGEDFLGKIFGKKKKKEEKDEAGKPVESKPVKEEPKVTLYKKYGLDKLFGEKLASKEEIENVVDKLHLEFDPLGNVKGIEIPDELKITDFNDPEKYLKQYKQMQGYFDYGGKEPEVEQKAGTVANKDVKIDKPIIPEEDKNTDVAKPTTNVVSKIDEMKPGDREIVEMEESKIKEKVERESDIWIRIEKLLTQIADNTKGIDSGFDKISKVSGSNIVYSKSYSNIKENTKKKENGNVIVPIVDNSGVNTDAMNINNIDQETMKRNNQYYIQMKEVSRGGSFTTHNLF